MSRPRFEDLSTGLALVHEYLVCGPLGLFVQAYLDETGRAALADARSTAGRRAQPQARATGPGRAPGGGPNPLGSPS
jgi:hypothetical protein